MAYDKARVERNCKVGKMVAEKLEELGQLEETVDALTEKLQAVLDATAADSTKTLKIDTDGNVELAT